MQNNGENWRQAFMPLLEGVTTDTQREWSTALGVDFSIRNWRGEAWFQDYTLQFAQPITDTSAEDIRSIVAAGQAEGWSIAELQSGLTTLFNQYIDGDATGADFDFFQRRLPPHRTELIARTETMRMANAGTHRLGKDWGITHKTWLYTSDDRTRESHRAAGVAYSEGGQPGAILLDEPFMVGGYPMLHPLDMSLGASIKEVANCRCSENLVMPPGGVTTGGAASAGRFAGPEAGRRVASENLKITGYDPNKDNYGFSERELAALVGDVPIDPNAPLDIIYWTMGGKPAIALQFEQYEHEQITYMRRVLQRDGENLIMHNTTFVLGWDVQGSGLGTQIFSSQVDALRRAGVSQIVTHAARETNMNGYYTWPRLGYDRAFDEGDLEELSGTPFANAQRVSDLMTTPEGREWWRDNGHSLEMTFDLTDGSTGLTVLNNYLDERGVDISWDTKAVAGLTYKASQSKAEWPPELTPAEERTLDAVWNALGEQRRALS